MDMDRNLNNQIGIPLPTLLLSGLDTLRDLHDLIEPHHCQYTWNRAVSERVQKWRYGQW